MLVKLTTLINVTKILLDFFAQIFFSQKITNTNCKYRKAAQNTFVQKAACKMFVK